MTREEAMEIVKKLYNDSLLKKDNEAMLTLIPELAENDEERMCKAALEGIEYLERKLGWDFIGDTDILDVKEYLERQKDQKPVHTAKEAWKEMRLEVYAQASGNRHEPNYSDDSTKMFSLCDIDEIIEKISDSTVWSQPAEWSEEDKKSLDWIIKHFSQSEELYHDLIERLKSFRLRSNWKPSQVQMEALAWYSWNSGVPPTGDKAIRLLYNDLQKLL